ncbi:hypothetical protein B0H21DRAFT_894208 [Amylocystis lapponica]|nr:hypothetical protein B0H21DRAFT_894208 [Amylocystis lapponica]
MDHEFLSGLTRGQIQKLAKQAGLKANDKTEDIILRLLAKDTEKVSPPVEKAKGPMRRSARVARLTSTSYGSSRRRWRGWPVWPQKALVAPGNAEASGSKAHQGGKAMQGLRQSASKRPRALKSLDARSRASSSEVSQITRNLGQWPNAPANPPLVASAQGATAHHTVLQQVEQGSSSQAPSALHRPVAVDLRDAQSTRPGSYYPINPPSAQSAARGTVAGPSHAPFADMTATASWASASLPAPLRTPRLDPAQWPAPAPMHAPTLVRASAPAPAPQREPARWVPEPAAQPAAAPAPMPRQVVSSTSIKNAERELAQWEHDDVVALQRIVEVRKLKRGVDEATATISAEVDRLTALRLAVERHVLARLKTDRALLGEAMWVPDASYLEWLESQRREQEVGVRGVNEDVRHEFAPLGGEEESNEEDFPQFRRGRSSAATPYRPRKRRSDDSEMDPRAQKRRRS